MELMSGDTAPIGALSLPDGLDRWLVEFIGKAVEENAILRSNGAITSAIARETLLSGLVTMARGYLDELIDLRAAARLMGTSEETARRKVRGGILPDTRSTRRSRIQVRRGDAIGLARPRTKRYDPVADAQDVAKLRRDAA